MSGHDLLVQEGKIAALAPDLKPKAPPGCKIVEGRGKHLTPGLIDCHSHAMILGRVNESTMPSTAMVRIADVINSESINIERQLAGGLTACNLLHGSANPIGGQNAVIKLRLGAAPDGMILKAAPSGIKFALGESVKQANWGGQIHHAFPSVPDGGQNLFREPFHRGPSVRIEAP